MNCIAMHLILLPVSGYELSSDEEEIPLQPDDPADGGSALDDMQPHNGVEWTVHPTAAACSDTIQLCCFHAPIRREYNRIVGHNTRS